MPLGPNPDSFFSWLGRTPLALLAAPARAAAALEILSIAAVFWAFVSLDFLTASTLRAALAFGFDAFGAAALALGFAVDAVGALGFAVDAVGAWGFAVDAGPLAVALAFAAAAAGALGFGATRTSCFVFVFLTPPALTPCAARFGAIPVAHKIIDAGVSRKNIRG